VEAVRSFASSGWMYSMKLVDPVSLQVHTNAAAPMSKM